MYYKRLLNFLCPDNDSKITYTLQKAVLTGCV